MCVALGPRPWWGATTMTDAWQTPVNKPDEVELSPTGARIGDPASELELVDDLERHRLFNLDFIDCADMKTVADAIINGHRPRRSGQLPYVVTPNVDIIVQMTQRPDSVETGVLLGAQYCLPDGQPIVTASKVLGRPLATRLAGRLLFSELWPRFVDKGLSVTVIASSDEIASGLVEENPKANVLVAPMFDRDDTATIDGLALAVIEDAQHLDTKFVLSGIGFPKDLLIAEAIVRQWPADGDEIPMTMGLGASFAFHLGLTDKAPDWVARIGLEWFHRFMQEPRRLFHRYFIRDMRFIPLVWQEWRVSKQQEEVTANG